MQPFWRHTDLKFGMTTCDSMAKISHGTPDYTVGTNTESSVPLFSPIIYLYISCLVMPQFFQLMQMCK